MPRRNLIVIIAMSIIALVCYERAAMNRYADVFSRVMNLIDDRYVEKVDTRDLFEGAIEGMVGRLDEHSAYISPEQYSLFKTSLDQEFGGIGIEVVVDPDTKRLTVKSPLIDTPAYEAGIRAGDTIMSIDGVDTKGLTLRDSVGVLRGRPGTPVTMTVLHQGEDKPVELEIVRAVIQIDSVLGDTHDTEGRWNFYLEEDSRIGYVRLTTFGEHSDDELYEALQFEEHPVDGLILDLRNNPGGLLPVAIDACDMFVDEGPIVSTRGRDGEIQDEYRARSRTIVPGDLPVAVLVNRYSASASEILAACLQDHGRAVVIGQRTWGKGTVQNVIPIEGGKSRLKLTTANYWRPSGRNIHRRPDATDEQQWGVKPNPGFEVLLTDEQFEKVFTQRRDRDVVKTDAHGNGVLPNGNGASPNGDGADAEEPFDDPQLRRAIRFIQSKRKPKKA